MRSHWLTALALVGLLALASPAASPAAQGKGKGKQSEKAAMSDKEKGKPSNASREDKYDEAGGKKNKYKDKGKDRDHGWERRDGYDYRSYDRDDRPPGWNRGKKTGWSNCDVPPGQAKKGSCRTYRYGGHRYYYFYDPDGRMVVRRREITPHAY